MSDQCSGPVASIYPEHQHLNYNSLFEQFRKNILLKNFNIKRPLILEANNTGKQQTRPPKILPQFDSSWQINLWCKVCLFRKSDFSISLSHFQSRCRSHPPVLSRKLHRCYGSVVPLWLDRVFLSAWHVLGTGRPGPVPFLWCHYSEDRCWIPKCNVVKQAASNGEWLYWLECQLQKKYSV